jgi:tetratricopeptide (TPR) repeat protein
MLTMTSVECDVMQMGLMHQEAGETATALKWLQRAAEADPNIFVALRNWALTLYKYSVFVIQLMFSLDRDKQLEASVEALDRFLRISLLPQCLPISSFNR